MITEWFHIWMMTNNCKTNEQFIAIYLFHFDIVTVFMEAQVSLKVAFSSSAFFGLLFLIFLLTIPHRFSMGFMSGEFSDQSSTQTPW